MATRFQRPVRVLRDSSYGFSLDSTIYVNIQRIWKETRKTTRFAREFEKTYHHELMHIIVTDAVRRKRVGERSEERVIRKLLREPWNGGIARLYN